MNKKGQAQNLIVFGIIAFVILFAGLILAFGLAIVDWTSDTIVPEFKNIGQVGDSNFTQYTEWGMGAVDKTIQGFVWLGGVIYVLALLSLFGIAFAFRFTGDRWLAGLFFVIVFMVIISAIFLSYIYQDFHDSNDEIGDRLREQAILSFFILYSPAIMSVICAICGIIMISGLEEATT